MIHIILGTRPEIIKMSPVVRACQKRNVDFEIVHTGQHYSYSMDRVFFEELELPDASYNLEVGSGSHAVQTGKILEGVEDVLVKSKPHVVLVQGDTNTVLAGALAAIASSAPSNGNNGGHSNQTVTAWVPLRWRRDSSIRRMDSSDGRWPGLYPS